MHFPIMLTENLHLKTPEKKNKRNIIRILCKFWRNQLLNSMSDL